MPVLCLLLPHWPMSHIEVRKNRGMRLQQLTTISLKENAGHGLLNLSQELLYARCFTSYRVRFIFCSFMPRILDNVIYIVGAQSIFYERSRETGGASKEIRVSWDRHSVNEGWLVEVEPGYGTSEMSSKETFLIELPGSQAG